MKHNTVVAALLLAVGLYGPAWGGGASIRVGRAAAPQTVPTTLAVGFAQSLTHSRVLSPVGQDLATSLLTRTPLQSYRETARLLAGANAGANAAEAAAQTPLAMRASAARLFADYNQQVENGASPRQLRRWLESKEQIQRLGILYHQYDALAAGQDTSLQDAFNTLVGGDHKLITRMHAIRRQLEGDARQAQSISASDAVVAAPAAGRVESGLAAASADSQAHAHAVADVPEPTAPAGPTAAEFKKAVKTFLLIFSTVIAGGLAWIGAGHLGFVNPQHGVEFLMLYGVELSLSTDNLIAFTSILAPLALVLKPKTITGILQTGLWGALVLRILASLFGLNAIAAYGSLALMIGGGVLVALAMKMVLPAQYNPIHLLMSALSGALSRIFKPLTELLKALFGSRKKATGVVGIVFGALLAVALTDLTFAVDSIPTALGISQNFTVIMLANIASVLGLSQLYVILRKAADRFHLVPMGVGASLLMVAAKMVFESMHMWHIGLIPSAALVLAPIFVFLALSQLIKPGSDVLHLVPRGAVVSFLAIAAMIILHGLHLWPLGLMWSAAAALAPVILAAALSPFVKPVAEAHA